MAETTVYADGQPIALDIAMQAAEWLTTLMDGDATVAQRQAWRAWRDAHPDHDRAWRHIEQVSGNFQELDARASRQALARQPTARRQGLRALVWLAAFGATGWFASRSDTRSARYRHAAGPVAARDASIDQRDHQRAHGEPELDHHRPGDGAGARRHPVLAGQRAHRLYCTRLLDHQLTFGCL